MSLSENLREQVRQRAGCACEFCGVSEIDVGGLLTVDHFQPRSKGGLDVLENLVYSCIRCNQHKQDYWTETDNASRLWNPRKELFSTHFVETDNGQLVALTQTGEFTLRRLRLNREPLVAQRLRRRQQIESARLLERTQDLLGLLVELNRQLANVSLEQQELLRVQRDLIKALLRKRNS
jgi:HNH endonuclease